MLYQTVRQKYVRIATTSAKLLWGILRYRQPQNTENIQLRITL